jgi:serine/threonine protein kinase
MVELETLYNILSSCNENCDKYMKKEKLFSSIKELGSGQNGIVYLIVFNNNTKICLKIITAKDTHGNIKNFSAIKEAYSLIMGSKKPYFIKIHRVIENKEKLYIIMDYLDTSEYVHLEEYLINKLSKNIIDATYYELRWAILSNLIQVIIDMCVSNIIFIDFHPGNIFFSPITGKIMLTDYDDVRQDCKSIPASLIFYLQFDLTKFDSKLCKNMIWFSFGIIALNLLFGYCYDHNTNGIACSDKSNLLCEYIFESEKYSQYVLYYDTYKDVIFNLFKNIKLSDFMNDFIKFLLMRRKFLIQKDELILFKDFKFTILDLCFSDENKDRTINTQQNKEWEDAYKKWKSIYGKHTTLAVTLSKDTYIAPVAKERHLPSTNSYFQGPSTKPSTNSYFQVPAKRKYLKYKNKYLALKKKLNFT